MPSVTWEIAAVCPSTSSTTLFILMVTFPASSPVLSKELVTMSTTRPPWEMACIEFSISSFVALADEVRSLAAKSAEAAKDTSALIDRSLHDVKTGTESTNLAISAMQVINECIQSIKVQMDEIALASVQQSEMIVSVENRIKEVSKVIQENSDAAEESAAISNELTEQSQTLNRLISQFRIQ